MSPAFARHFENSLGQKTAAGLGDAIRRLERAVKERAGGAAASVFVDPATGNSIRSGVIQTAAGMGAGAALSNAEQTPSMTPAGREANFLVNLGAGFAAGNPWARRIFKNKEVNPVTGAVTWEMSPKKVVGSATALAAKTLGLKTWDQGNRMVERGADAVDTVSSSVKELMPIIRELQETVAGPADIRTPEDAAKAFAEGRAIGIRDYINLAASKGGDVSKKVDNVVNTLSESMSGMDSMVKDIGTRVNQVLPHLEAFGNLAKWIPENTPKILAGAGGTALLGGGLYAAYNLLRDKLNYERVRREKEERRVPKLASAIQKLAGPSGMAYMQAYNSPEQVRARQQAVDAQQAVDMRRRAAEGRQAIALARERQAQQAQLATPSGMNPSDVVRSDDGSITVYDKNGRPVGTNRPVQKPKAPGSESTYPRNPNLGAQIAAQAPGAPAPQAGSQPSPFKTPAIQSPAQPAAPVAPAGQQMLASSGSPATRSLNGGPTAPATPAPAAAPAAPASDPFAAVPKPNIQTPDFSHTFDAAFASQPPAAPAAPASGNPFDGIVQKPGPIPNPFAATAPAAPGIAGGAFPPPVSSPPQSPAALSTAMTPAAPAAPMAPAVPPPAQASVPPPPAPAPAAPDPVTASVAAPGGSQGIMHDNSAMAAGQKVAGWAQYIGARPRLNTFVHRVVPAAGVGTIEALVSKEIEPDNNMMAVASGLVGAASGANIFRAKKVPAGAPPSYKANPNALKNTMLAAVLPRTLMTLQGAAKNLNASAGLKNSLSSLATPAAVGGGVLGLAALAALYQGSRAAKRVGDGDPLVKADSTHNVFAGGAGGPGNPNVGGKIKVTLPTRNPRDNETVVEIPMENIPLPGTVLDRVRRDTKRRLRSEGNVRTIHRDDPDDKTVQKMMLVN